jgi:hypothetical protein
MHRILKPNGLLIYLVQHPLILFAVKRDKTYHKKEVVDFAIPDLRKPCSIKLPAHTFSEYFNDFVLHRFDLLDFAEGREAVPMWFLAKLRKR